MIYILITHLSLRSNNSWIQWFWSHLDTYIQRYSHLKIWDENRSPFQHYKPCGCIVWMHLPIARMLGECCTLTTAFIKGMQLLIVKTRCFDTPCKDGIVRQLFLALNEVTCFIHLENRVQAVSWMLSALSKSTPLAARWIDSSNSTKPHVFVWNTVWENCV